MVVQLAQIVSRFVSVDLSVLADETAVWSAISQVSGQNVSAIAQAWIYQTGHPVVNVEKIAPSQIKLTQHRFLSSGKPTEEEDYIW